MRIIKKIGIYVIIFLTFAVNGKEWRSGDSLPKQPTRKLPQSTVDCVQKTETFTPTDDTYWDTNSQSSNYASSPQLVLGHSYAGLPFLRFDVASAAANKQILKATLRFSNIIAGFDNPIRFEVRNLAVDFDENSVSLSNLPTPEQDTVGRFLGHKIQANASTIDVELDVQKLKILNGIIGFELRAMWEHNNVRETLVFSSSNGSSSPELILTYCDQVTSSCLISAKINAQQCNDYATTSSADDHFSVTFTANHFDGSSQGFDVFNGSTLMATGEYRKTITIGGDESFRADGVTSFAIRLVDKANPNCIFEMPIPAVAACSFNPNSCAEKSITLRSVYDGFVQESDPSSSFSSDTYLAIGQSDEGSKSSYLLFDRSGFKDKKITSAKLRFKESRYRTAGTTKFDIFRIPEIRTINTLTWDTQKETDAIKNFAGSFTGRTPAENGIVEILINTDFLLKDLESTITFQLVAIAGSPTTDLFLSSTEGEFIPELVISYCDQPEKTCSMTFAETPNNVSCFNNATFTNSLDDYLVLNSLRPNNVASSRSYQVFYQNRSVGGGTYTGGLYQPIGQNSKEFIYKENKVYKLNIRDDENHFCVKETILTAPNCDFVLPVGECLKTFDVSEDTYISSILPMNNFGQNNALKVKNDASETLSSLLKFNTTELNGRSIKELTLYLNESTNDAAGNANFKVKNIETDWSENATNFSNKPTISGIAGAYSTGQLLENQSIAITLDKQVAKNINNTISLFLEADPNTSVTTSFGSKQSTLAPKIVIRYGCQNNYYTLKIKAGLEGFWNGTTHVSSLVQKNLIPRANPFSRPPFNHFQGNEQVLSFPENTVDWVLVVARDSVGAVLKKQAALLKSDGSIVNTNGLDLDFGLLNGSVYFSIHHRSHLAVMSNLPIQPNVLYDLSTGLDKVKGEQQLKLVNGKWCMFAGDFDQNGLNNNLDFNAWRAVSSQVNQYFDADADGNGLINNLDFNFWRRNRSKVGIPEIKIF